MTLISLFPLSWLVMLLIGAAHSGTDAVPALGYWPTFAVLFAVALIVGVARGNTRSSN